MAEMEKPEMEKPEDPLYKYGQVFTFTGSDTFVNDNGTYKSIPCGNGGIIIGDNYMKIEDIQYKIPNSQLEYSFKFQKLKEEKKCGCECRCLAGKEKIMKHYVRNIHCE